MSNQDSSKKSACWTCRLRHKRCDEQWPICTPCSELEITCHFTQERPAWMDNGLKQQQVSRQLKTEVAQSAKRRRGLAKMGHIAAGIAGISSPAQLFTSPPSRDDAHGGNLTQYRPPIGPAPEGRDNQCSREFNNPPTSSYMHSYGGPPAQGRHNVIDLQNPREFSGAELSVMHIGFIMTYIDYVFPLLYPLYRPSVLEGGRSWVLALAMQSQSFSNSIISLSSYFFSVIPVEHGPGHRECTSTAWDMVREQSTQALSQVRKDIQSLVPDRIGSSLSDNLTLLATIVQLLIFDVQVPTSTKWQTHFGAAVNFHEQIIDRCKRETSLSAGLKAALQVIKSASVPIYVELGAFQFYSSVLIFCDVLASTVTGEVPKLYGHYSELRGVHAEDAVFLDTNAITGCQAWALLLVGDIAALGAWKKTGTASGLFSRDELSCRANEICERRKLGLDRLNRTTHSSKNSPSTRPSRPIEALLEQSECSYGLRPFAPNRLFQITQIWSGAGHIYLLIIVHGWQPKKLEIQHSVSNCIELLQEVSSPSWLRSLLWPLCIVGCLAPEEKRSIIQERFSFLGALGNLGTVRETMQIIQAVWAREDLAADTWDVAACLRILGHNSLLI
ncbi:hypothetical protein AUP68_02344 [Ilyonectria robusta]